jgi:hypothetical protein
MIGFAYVFFGVYLIASPALGEASLALVLASLFLFEGIFDIAMFLRLRTIEGSSWVLLDGISHPDIGADELHAVAIPQMTRDSKVHDDRIPLSPPNIYFNCWVFNELT